MGCLPPPAHPRSSCAVIIGYGYLGGGPEPEPGGSIGLRALTPSGACSRGPVWAWSAARASGRLRARVVGARRNSDDLRHPRASLPGFGPLGAAICRTDRRATFRVARPARLDPSEVGAR